MARRQEPLAKTEILGLAAMGLAVLVIANDFTALSVALPAIEADFTADVTTVQWIITGYALVFGVLIVTGGRLADMFGRRRVFFIGTGIFSIFSALGGLADNVWILLASRGLMAVGGAMMWPAILGMTYALIPSSRAALAGGLIMGAAGFGNALGPLLGGTLTDILSWRWIFYLNLPIGVAAILVTLWVVPAEKPNEADRKIDYTGVTTLSLGLFALLLSLDLGTDLGWSDYRVLGLFTIAAVALAAFARVEKVAGTKALIPGDVLDNHAFFAAGMATLLMSAIFFASLLYLPQFMTKQLGYSAMKAGAGMLPMMGSFALVSFVAAPLYGRLGAKLIIAIGALCLGGGIFLLSWMTTATTFLDLVPGMVVLGVGVGLFYSSITTVAITALDPSRSSLAGAIIYMFQIGGGAIGLGLNTALVVTAPTLPEGINIAFRLDAALAGCGLLVVLFFVGGKIDRERLKSLIHHHRAHG
jgi:EmrB/QacA subfamily drug resistance transporter